jgi:hypothetical protein
MNYEQTTAFKCRYGEAAAPLFDGCMVLWEDSEDDYQGHAKVLAKGPADTYRLVAWTYGSCSGCDEWEDRNLAYTDITAEMRKTMAVFTKDSLRAYADGLAKENALYWERESCMDTKSLHDAIRKEAA